MQISEKINHELIVRTIEDISCGKIVIDDYLGVLKKAEKLWEKLNGFDNDQLSGEILYLKCLLAYRYAHIFMHGNTDLESIQLAEKLFHFADYHLNDDFEFSSSKFLAKCYRIAVLQRLNLLNDNTSNNDMIQRLWADLQNIMQSKFIATNRGKFESLNNIYFNMMEILSYGNVLNLSNIEGTGVCDDIALLKNNNQAWHLVYSKPDYSHTGIHYSRSTALNIARSFQGAYIFEATIESARWITYPDKASCAINDNNINILQFLMYNPFNESKPSNANFRQAKTRFLIDMKSRFGDSFNIHESGRIMSISTDFQPLIIGVFQKSCLNRIRNEKSYLYFFRHGSYS